jgi:hypothetical protein
LDRPGSFISATVSRMSRGTGRRPTGPGAVIVPVRSVVVRRTGQQVEMFEVKQRVCHCCLVERGAGTSNQDQKQVIGFRCKLPGQLHWRMLEDF